MRYLLVALLALLIAPVGAQPLNGPPIAPGSLHWQPAPYGHDITWVAAERMDAWRVERNGGYYYQLVVGVPVGETARVPVFDVRPGDAFRVCGSRPGVTVCQAVRPHRVVLSLLHG